MLSQAPKLHVCLSAQPRVPRTARPAQTRGVWARALPGERNTMGTLWRGRADESPRRLSTAWALPPLVCQTRGRLSACPGSTGQAWVSRLTGSCRRVSSQPPLSKAAPTRSHSIVPAGQNLVGSKTPLLDGSPTHSDFRFLRLAHLLAPRPGCATPRPTARCC